MVLIAQCIQWYFPEIESSFLSAAGGQNWLWTLIVASPLLPINFCAGATFPRLLLSDFNSTTVGRLSAVETLGGCVGAVTAGCFAMQTFGLMPTFVGAGLLAVVIGVAAHERGRCAVEQSADEKIAFHVLAAVGIAGVASLGMEIVWQRLLILIVGTDSYSYTIVVTSYLLGIAIGAAAGALCLRARSQAQGEIRLSTVATLQVLVGISSLLVLLVVIYRASGAG